MCISLYNIYLKSHMESDKSLREDDHKHLQCIIQLLTVYLKEVYKIVTQLREIHLKKTQNLLRICRLADLVDLYESNLLAIKIEDEVKIRRVKALEEGFEREAAGGGEDEEGCKKIMIKSFRLFQKKMIKMKKQKRKLSLKMNYHKLEMIELDKEISSMNQCHNFNKNFTFKSTAASSDHGLSELSKEEQLLVENEEELFIRFARTNTETEKASRFALFFLD